MILVDWGDADDQIIIMKFIDDWTVEQYRAAMIKRHRMILSKSYPVATIADMRRSGSIPRDILATAVTLAHLEDPHQGQISVISDNPIWKQLWKIVSSVSRAKTPGVSFVHTVEDAYIQASSHQI